ncbi:MAG: CBS domain-containing protein [Candidatus Hodarchaeales archaeon]
MSIIIMKITYSNLKKRGQSKLQINPSYLKKLRKQKGWTQDNLSKLTGISQAHIAKIENNQIDPRLSTVNKLLRALTEDVLDDTETIQRIMSKNIAYCYAEDTLAAVSVKMLKFGYSMLPVFDVNASGSDKIIGNITEKILFQVMMAKKKPSEITVKTVMEEALPVATVNTSIDDIPSIMGENGAVIIVDTKTGEPMGIITRNDLFKTILP